MCEEKRFPKFEFMMPDYFMEYRIYKCPRPLDLQQLISNMRKLNKESNSGFLQLVDATKIIHEKQLVAACWHAIYAFQEKMNISRSLEIETLLYLTGTRQINQALDIVGLSVQSSLALLINVQKNEEHILQAFNDFEKTFQWHLADSQHVRVTPEKIKSILSLYLGEKRNGDESSGSEFLHFLETHPFESEDELIDYCVNWLLGYTALTATKL